MAPETARVRVRTVVGLACVLAACAGIALVMLLRSGSPDDPYSAARMGEVVRMRCTETGGEWDAVRGRVEAELMSRPGPIDASVGVASPFAEGRLTGVMMDLAQWHETVDRINTEKSARGAGSAAGGQPTR